jgi:GTPase SAR1 family protein
MGGCGSSPEDAEAKKASKALQKELEEANRLEQEKIKLLLLGAGESGKSTIFKQMKVLYGVAWTEDERKGMTPVVYNNTITSMKILVEHTESLGYAAQVVCKETFAKFQNVSDEDEITPDIGKMIKELWEDVGVQECWKVRSTFQIVESVKAYFNKIDEISADGYIASEADILLSRVRTSGIVEEQYMIDGAKFCMFDVGGQRNERKKWIHCFDDVTAVIFVAALSEYDQVLYEDANTNRMVEAVDLFDEICNNQYFADCSMILFLNKRDLFEDKIKRVSIASVKDFEDYPGAPNDYENGCTYFTQLFLDRNKSDTNEKEIYHHITCATDTRNVEVVFNACKDIILKNNMKSSGFM